MRIVCSFRRKRGGGCRRGVVKSAALSARVMYGRPMQSVTIERIGKGAVDSDVRGLAKVLVDAVDGGASVSFMAGLTEGEAEAWWRSVVASLSERAILLVARDEQGIVGTVQAQPSWAPNQPHRGDVAKL